MLLLATNINAQQMITFDTNDFIGIGVYDSSPNSPLRKGKIKGNAQVVANPMVVTDTIQSRVTNPTRYVVAVQRSRFGSNTYGVRIDLKEPIRMTKEEQFIHFLTLVPNKPAVSNMMVIGLGKRTEKAWEWQDGLDEQFWAVSKESIAASNSWQRVTCSFKGFSYSREENPESGIEINSLIIIPDVRSAHADTTDWIAYFDQIIINQEP